MVAKREEGFSQMSGTEVAAALTEQLATDEEGGEHFSPSFGVGLQVPV